MTRLVVTARARCQPRVSRRTAGLAAHAVLALAGLLILLPTAAEVPPDRLELLLALVAIAVVCELSEAWLPSGVHFNATLATAIMGLAIGGPLAAFAVLLLPDLVAAPLRRDERFLRAGNLANVAAYSWAAIAGAAVLGLGHVSGLALSDAPTLMSAGVALAVVNFAVGPAIYAPLQLGVPFQRMPSELAGTLPAMLVIVLTGTLTSALIPTLGIFALAGFALVVLVPTSVLNLLARARPAAELSVGEAIGLYAAAIGDVLGLDRRDRAVLARAATLLAQEPDAYRRLLQTLPRPGGSHDPDRLDVGLVAAHAEERYDGAGRPAGLDTEHIPPLSRVLAVARRWAALTAEGTAELSHVEALLDLEAQSGAAFDPAVVSAAGVVVERDTRLAPVPAAQPRVHTWPGSAALRTRIAPRLLALAAE